MPEQLKGWYQGIREAHKRKIKLNGEIIKSAQGSFVISSKQAGKTNRFRSVFFYKKSILAAKMGWQTTCRKKPPGQQNIGNALFLICKGRG